MTAVDKAGRFGKDQPGTKLEQITATNATKSLAVEIRLFEAIPDLIFQRIMLQSGL